MAVDGLRGDISEAGMDLLRKLKFLFGMEFPRFMLMLAVGFVETQTNRI